MQMIWNHPSDFKRRLAADELLATQLALAIVRERTRKKRGRVLKGDGSIRKKLFDVLPYELTGDQQKALSEIIHDLESERAMLRLVQGDVGSGKTVVALLAMAAATEAGVQSAIFGANRNPREPASGNHQRVC